MDTPTLLTLLALVLAIISAIAKSARFYILTASVILLAWAVIILGGK